MSEKMYQFITCDNNISQAIQVSSSFHENKPDDSWYEHLEKKFPQYSIFWKEKGFKRYTSSKLRDWHLSLIEGKTKLITANSPQNIIYEDEYQIVCEKENIQILQEYPFTYEGPRPFTPICQDSRPSFIRNHTSLRDWNAYSFYSGSNETFSLMASMGEELGLKRIGIHHEILKPGKRSSWPHAHSMEEELVYILNGRPDIWINGKLFKANPHDVIFFPPGTNLAHTIINHSQSDVVMMVFGEQNLQDDRIYYPKHPLRNKECQENGYLWETPPKVSLGPHSGSPHENSFQREVHPWKYQKNVMDISEEVHGGPQNPSAVFYKTRDFGRKLGAKKVALHHQVLPSGFRSSLPHAESHEEEFIFVLKGRPQVWVNGHLYQLEKGDSVAFPSGTGIAHSFINNTKEDVELIVSGERTKEKNRCSFPLNPEEKANCDFWWDSAPTQVLGSDSPWPTLFK